MSELKDQTRNHMVALTAAILGGLYASEDAWATIKNESPEARALNSTLESYAVDCAGWALEQIDLWIEEHVSDEPGQNP